MLQGSNTAWDLPDLVGGGAVCLGAALSGVTDLEANCEPTALSKNPPLEAGLVGAAFLGAGLAGLSDRLANCAPTASSKKPLVVPAT